MSSNPNEHQNSTNFAILNQQNSSATMNMELFQSYLLHQQQNHLFQGFSMDALLPKSYPFNFSNTQEDLVNLRPAKRSLEDDQTNGSKRLRQDLNDYYINTEAFISSPGMQNFSHLFN